MKPALSHLFCVNPDYPRFLKIKFFDTSRFFGIIVFETPLVYIMPHNQYI